MIREKLQEGWRQFKSSTPGSRFQDRYHRRQRSRDGRVSTARVTNFVAGGALILAGLFMVVFPTPAGWVLAVVGLVVIAGEVEPLARFMDWVEVTARGAIGWAVDFWGKSSRMVRVLTVAAVVAAVAALGYGAYSLVFGG